MIVQRHDNVFVYFDGIDNLMIKLPDSYKKSSPGSVAVKGLCGNYDGDDTNDLVGLDGKTYTRKEINEFGNSWKEDIQCKLEPAKPKTCYTLPGETYEQAIDRAVKLCSVIDTNKAFSSCHPKLKTNEFRLMCIADVCACNVTARPGYECACNALSWYSRSCAWNHNETLNWRSPSLCRKYDKKWCFFS